MKVGQQFKLASRAQLERAKPGCKKLHQEAGRIATVTLVDADWPERSEFMVGGWRYQLVTATFEDIMEKK